MRVWLMFVISAYNTSLLFFFVRSFVFLLQEKKSAFAFFFLRKKELSSLEKKEQPIYDSSENWVVFFFLRFFFFSSTQVPWLTLVVGERRFGCRFVGASKHKFNKNMFIVYSCAVCVLRSHIMGCLCIVYLYKCTREKKS